MGGGDLNLKKSWHPHTMKNQEKVWKAEQAKSQEEKKVNDLRKEIEEEKNRDELKRIGKESGVLGRGNDGDKKLDWMYKNSTELINREEYLLGRKIDKSFETLQAEEKEQKTLVGVKQPLNHVEHDCVPFSIRVYKNLENAEQVDLQRKVMEDPLMLIKQREMDSRRKILENPVKLKELHRILKTDEKLQKASKRSKKSKKSKKKHKRRSKSSSSSKSGSESDSDLDRKLAKKLKQGLINKEEASGLGIHLTKLLDSKFQKISQELDKSAGKKKKRSEKPKSRNAADREYRSDHKRTFTNKPFRSSSEHRKYENRDSIPRSVSRDGEKKLNRYEERNSNSNKRRDNSRKRSRSTSRNEAPSSERKIRISRESPLSKDYRNSNKSYLKPMDRSRSHKSRSKSRTHTSSRSHHRPHKSDTCSSTAQASNTFTDKEKQEKLREMMSNAAWREEERTNIVRKHRESYAREEERHTARDFDKDFLNKEVRKAMAKQTSVGSRLRANVNNIQRTSLAMNSNFARK